MLPNSVEKKTSNSDYCFMKRKAQQNITSHSIDDFFGTEAAGGILLILAASFAMIAANSSLSVYYDHLINMKISVLIGEAGLSKTIHHWINDGLMAIFFFMVGLEIKREFLAGELSTRETSFLPAIAAIGGMAVPALVFCLINKDQPQNLAGWAIPSATDIAFALGILSLLGNRIPASLKALLLAIAVLDDLGAVIIIALFYTANLSLSALLASALCITVLFAMNRLNVLRPAAYILVGIALWVAVLKSGVHATLAGVTAALFIPMSGKQGTNMLEDMVHKLHPWVAFMIMPVFAFANAGVSLSGLSLQSLLQPLPLGITAGLFIGKQVGIFGMIFLAVKSGLSSLPKGTNWWHIYGVSLLCGVGFTMSLFIGSLAYETDEFIRDVRLGVLTGSLLSSVAGYFVLRLFSGEKS